jgi:hypothetical protein
MSSSALQRREWSFQSERKNFGDTYDLMVQARRNLASPDVLTQDYGLDYGLTVTLTAETPELTTRCSNGSKRDSVRGIEHDIKRLGPGLKGHAAAMHPRCQNCVRTVSGGAFGSDEAPLGAASRQSEYRWTSLSRFRHPRHKGLAPAHTSCTQIPSWHRLSKTEHGVGSPALADRANQWAEGRLARFDRS